MSKRHGKKYIEAAKKVEAAVAANGNGGLDPEQAVALAKETSISKFDATVEAHIRLGVDPRHAEQMVRGSVVLPNGTGKKVRVAVFATGDKQREAQEAGADFVGGDDLVKKVSDGWTDFDAAVATPDIMSKVGPLGKILGPRGLMPNPKSGTVTFDVARAVREVKGGKVEFRTDKFGIVHAPIGKVSFDQKQLHQNLGALVDALIRNKPATSKGQYLRRVYLAATQGGCGIGRGRQEMSLRDRYAFTQVPLRKLKSGYLAGNDASARAQAAAGYREVGRHEKDMFSDGEWRDHVMTEVMREDWLKANSL